MSFDYQVNPDAPVDSLERKRPPVDNGAQILDPARYHSAEFMQLEWQRMWPKVWLLAGVTSDIPEAGDYFTFEIGHESILVTRQDDGSVKAFYNVCPHRANRVALNTHGSVDHFTCAFHGWKFHCNGSLKAITDEETFNPSLVAHRPGLTEVRCDTHAGLVFVNLDGKAQPLAEWIGLPKGYLENYRIDEMHAVRHVRTVWSANWKVGVDSFYETYHLPHIHPQTQTVMGDFSQYDLYPNGFSRMIVPLCRKSHRVADQETVDAGLRFMMTDAGMDPDSFTGNAREVRAAVQLLRQHHDVPSCRRPDLLRAGLDGLAQRYGCERSHPAEARDPPRGCGDGPRRSAQPGCRTRALGRRRQPLERLQGTDLERTGKPHPALPPRARPLRQGREVTAA